MHLLWIACLGAMALAAMGFLFEQIYAGEREYRYARYVPREYDPDQRWPLVVFLNGAGECGEDGSRHLAVGLAPAIMVVPEKWPCIAVFPQKPDVHQHWSQHEEAVIAMVRATQRDYSIDDSRISLTGLSQGGNGTWEIGAMHAGLWSALAPICGYGNGDRIASALAKLPIWCFHGDADAAVPVEQSRQIVEAIRREGGDPRLTIYPGVGHNSWDQAYRTEELGPWLVSQRRPEARA